MPWMTLTVRAQENREERSGTRNEGPAIMSTSVDTYAHLFPSRRRLHSPARHIQCRILAKGKPTHINAAFWEGRCRNAVQRRIDWMNAGTTGLRWVHGENDGFPGLVLDRYGSTGVMKVYSSAWLPHLAEVGQAIRDVFAPETLVLRTSRNVASAAASAGFPDGSVMWGNLPSEPVVFTENGIRFEADVVRGQKTGFFLDQRDNREWVGTVSEGRNVLNAFSFSGGFSLYAARGGAKSVTDLDISKHALASATRNFHLNSADERIARCLTHQVQADTFEWLASTPNRYDLIVLDPPSLAKKELERARAIEAYRRLARLGWQRLEFDGILLAASCSAHVSESEFVEAVRAGVSDAGGRSVELRRATHPRDHPITFPEAAYLKCIALRSVFRR